MNKYNDTLLNDCRTRLSYDPVSGVFTWLSRPSSDFALEREAKRWNSVKPGKIAGYKQYTTRGSKSHLAISINGRPYAAHRLAWLIEHGSISEDVFIDHINGDPFDNRMSNLRLSSNKQNQWNRRAPKNSSTGLSGVTWSKSMCKWKSTIRVNGKYFHLGYFDTRGMAAVANAKASLKMHGEFSPFLRPKSQPIPT